MREFGAGGPTVVILHGLGATGDYFGSQYDALGRRHRVMIPDLLGFGASLDEDRSSFGLEDHLDALDASLLVDSPPEDMVIIAHSMGSALAMAWADRHQGRVRSVVCSGAPIYADAATARTAIAKTNPMAQLLLLDEKWAQRACAFNCAHRTAAGWLGAGLDPSVPVAIARFASLHTWPAYKDSLQELVLRVDWARHMSALRAAGIPLTLLWGTKDPIGDVSFATELACGAEQSIVMVQGADHHLPVTHPGKILEGI